MRPLRLAILLTGLVHCGASADDADPSVSVEGASGAAGGPAMGGGSGNAHGGDGAGGSVAGVGGRAASGATGASGQDGGGGDAAAGAAGQAGGGQEGGGQGGNAHGGAGPQGGGQSGGGQSGDGGGGSAGVAQGGAGQGGAGATTGGGGPAANDSNAALLASCTDGPMHLSSYYPKLWGLASCTTGGFVSAKPQGGDVIAGFNDLTTGTHGVVRVPQAGGHPELLAHDPTAGVMLDELVVGPTDISYLVSSLTAEPSYTQLRFLAAPGATPTIVRTYAESEATVIDLADGGSEVFVTLLTDYANRIGKVVAFDKTTFAEREVAGGLTDPVQLVVDGDSLYATSFGVGVARAPKAGGVFEVIVPAVLRLGGLSVGADTIYFVDRGSYPDEADGRVLSAPKTGGSPVTFAPALQPDKRPLLDGTSVLLCASALPAPGDAGIEPRLTRFRATQPPEQLLSPEHWDFCSYVSFTTQTSMFLGEGAGLVRLDR